MGTEATKASAMKAHFSWLFYSGVMVDIEQKYFATGTKLVCFNKLRN